MEISNGASSESANGVAGIAPGSIFLIRGSGLGPEELVLAAAPYPKRLPAAPGGTRVIFRNIATGRAFPASLISSANDHVAGIAPSLMPPGVYSATVGYQDQSDTSEPFRVARSAPGLFTVSMTEFGPGVVQNYQSPGAISLNSLTKPARPGGHLIVWGTGLGDGKGQDSTIAEAANADVWVVIGNEWIRPSYAGPAPGLPGVDQFNVPLPSDFAENGCYIPLQVIASGARSNTVTISVSEIPGTCEHPLGLSTEVLERLDAGGRMALGEVSLWHREDFVRLPGADGVGIGLGSVQFSRANALGVLLNSGIFGPPAGGCRPSNTVPDGIASMNVPASTFLPLDAGSPTTVFFSGDSFKLKTQGAPDGAYVFSVFGTVAGPPSGVWRFAGAGGADVGPFDTEITVQPALAFSFSATVNLKEPVEVTWPPAGLDDFQWVTIVLSVQIPVREDQDPHLSPSLEVSCTAPATAARLTIPVEILQTLPTENDGSGSITFLLDSKPVTFTAAGLDYGVARMSVSETRSVKVE